MHPHLRRIFEANLAPGGTVIIADPVRKTSVEFLETMQADGWSITMSKWTVGIAPPERAVDPIARVRGHDDDPLERLQAL